jgi:hypothetical protein
MKKQRITKTHLIISFLARVGKATRFDTMRWVAAFEGKPFIETSNISYWSGPDNIIEKGYVQPVGKKGNAILYSATPMGLKKLETDDMMWIVKDTLMGVYDVQT